MGLVLTRREHQSIQIGKDIKVTVISPGKAKLLIEAPPEVKILRSELEGYERSENT